MRHHRPVNILLMSSLTVDDAEKGTVGHEFEPITLALPLGRSTPSRYTRHPVTHSNFKFDPIALKRPPQVAHHLLRLSKELPPLPTPRPRARRTKVSRWTKFELWWSTYRSLPLPWVLVDSTHFCANRKFFAFVLTLNLVGLFLAVIGKWSYPRHYTGAFVLGNLQVAILVRNELFVRFLYLFVNTVFAKVSIISVHGCPSADALLNIPVASSLVPSSMYFHIAASGWHPFWMCYLGIYMAHFSYGFNFPRPQTKLRFRINHGSVHPILDMRVCTICSPLV